MIIQSLIAPTKTKNELSSSSSSILVNEVWDCQMKSYAVYINVNATVNGGRPSCLRHRLEPTRVTRLQ